jgi:hypothetical protein
MRIGLSNAQTRFLQISSITAGTTALLVQMTNGLAEVVVVPTWIMWTLASMAVGTTVAGQVVRRRLGMYSNIAAVTLGTDDLLIEDVQAMTRPRRIALAEIHDIRLLDPATTWVERFFATYRQPIIRLRYRDRAAKVMYAQVDIVVGAPWIATWVDRMLQDFDVAWFIGSERVGDHARIRAWIDHHSSHTPDDLDGKNQMASDQLNF